MKVMTKCKCGEEMKFMWCWDDDQITDHCFNLYVCDYCGMIFKDEVCYKERIWIDFKNEVRKR